ncbi:MAG TPA: hypothetical protein VFB96_14615 [Pirellulaceae bacterium]|nr:hypothetical protein [Pirellulaceae bacterium]
MVSGLHQCAFCGADIAPAAERCWLCGQTAGAIFDRPPAAPRVSPPGGPRTFSLATLMLVVTGVCVWLGVTVQWPPVGIVLAILAVPAVARSWWYQRAWRKAGKPQTPAQAAISFLGSLLVVVTIAAAGLFALATAGHVALVASCSPLEKTSFGSGLIVTWVFVLAPALGLFIAGLLLWRLWIKQVRQSRSSGRPPTAKERVVAFVHALLVAASTLAAASASSFPVLWKLKETKIDYFNPRQAYIVWVIVWLFALTGFVASGTLAYWFSRRNLRLAGQIAATCAGVWLGVAIGESYWPRENSYRSLVTLGQFALLSLGLYYLLPLAAGSAAYWLYGLAARFVRVCLRLASSERSN